MKTVVLALGQRRFADFAGKNRFHPQSKLQNPRISGSVTGLDMSMAGMLVALATLLRPRLQQGLIIGGHDIMLMQEADDHMVLHAVNHR